MTGKCDARGDIYAAGILLMEMLSGRRRLAGYLPQQVIKHLTDSRFKLMPDELAALPERYREAVRCATDYVPQRRYRSALEMRQAFATNSAPAIRSGYADANDGGIGPSQEIGLVGRGDDWTRAGFTLMRTRAISRMALLMSGAVSLIVILCAFVLSLFL